METTLITATATDGYTARSALTDTEARACARLTSSTRRSDFRAGRLAAKRAASKELEAATHRRIQVLSFDDGSPRLSVLDARGRARDVPGTLSISHRDGRAIAVLAPEGLRVGVDLGRAGSVQLSAVHELLTPFEREIAREVDPGVVWSVKEAAWKALGLGHSLAFRDLGLRADACGQLLGVDVLGAFVPMHTRMVEPWKGYHVAMVRMSGGLG